MRLRMITGGACFRRLGALVDISTIQAAPGYGAVLLEYLAIGDILGERKVPPFMLLLSYGYRFKHIRKLIKTLNSQSIHSIELHLTIWMY